MGGYEIDQDVLSVGTCAPGERARIERRAAVHVADRIGSEHPHPLDESMPRLSGRLIAADPAVTAGLLELLAALGIRTDHIRRRA